MDTFGSCLERARKAAGFRSAGEFGKKLGVSHVTVRAWEKDEYKPSSDNIFEIVNILGEHSSLLPRVHYQNKNEKNQVSENAEYYGHIDAWDSETPLDEDEVEVPFFMEVELAAGIGGEYSLEIKGPKLRFSKSTLRRCGVQTEAAACVKVSGNSMEPRLFDGDVVGVDTFDRKIVDGKVYAINHSGLLRVKRLYRLPGGGVRVNSINSHEHPDELYPQEQMQELIIIGRVFWHSSIWN
tara:strand:+ start:2321 stop:3037 length:717 start_codon:yes stop_codon:yes gene_type:complete